MKTKNFAIQLESYDLIIDAMDDIRATNPREALHYWIKRQATENCEFLGKFLEFNAPMKIRVIDLDAGTSKVFSVMFELDYRLS